MTQDESWSAKYHEVVAFIEENHRNPSKHFAEERGAYLNWIKYNRKQLNGGKMKVERIDRFHYLLSLMNSFKRKNQYGQ